MRGLPVPAQRSRQRIDEIYQSIKVFINAIGCTWRVEILQPEPDEQDTAFRAGQKSVHRPYLLLYCGVEILQISSAVRGIVHLGQDALRVDKGWSSGGSSMEMCLISLSLFAARGETGSSGCDPPPGSVG